MRLAPEWKVRLIGLLAIATVGVCGYAVRERSATAGAEARVAQLAREAARANGVARAWQRQYAIAAARTQAASDGVTVARVAWRTRTDTLLVYPTTAADTARALAQLPGVKAAGDALADSARTLQVAVDSLRHYADSTITAKDTAIATQERVAGAQATLLDRLRTGPRVTGVGSVLFEPASLQPRGVAAQVNARVIGQWAVGVRGERRAAVGSHLDVVLSHPLF